MAVALLPGVAAAAGDFDDGRDDVWRQSMSADGEAVYAKDTSFPTADIVSLRASTLEDTGGGSSRLALQVTLAADPQDAELGFLVIGMNTDVGGGVLSDATHFAAVGFGVFSQESSLGRATGAGQGRQIGCPSFEHVWTAPTTVEVSFDTECIGGPRSLGVGAYTTVSDAEGQILYLDFAPELSTSPSVDEPRQPAALTLDLPGHGRRITPTGRDVSTTCDGAPDSGFSDAQGNVHRSSIDCVAAKGITKGKGDGTFGTGEALRRDQIASFLVSTMRAAGLALPSDVPNAFSDDEGNIHEDNIDILADLGIVDVPQDRRYRPGDLVTRADMATMVYRTADLVIGFPFGHAPPDYFTDDDQLSEDLERAIGGIAEIGVVTGKGGALYGPGETLRRDQMATFLARLLDALS